MKNKYKIGCVILNYNDSATVIKLLNKIKDFNCFNCIVVVDNNSTDDSFSLLSNIHFDKLWLKKTPRNGGYGYGNNFGMNIAFSELGCDAVIIANPDVDFSEKLVYRFIDLLEDKAIGAISAVQLDFNGNVVQNSAWRLPTKKQYIKYNSPFKFKSEKLFFYSTNDYFANKEMEVGCLAGSLVCITKNGYMSTKGYDENVFLYCEETILGFKMKKNNLKSVIVSDYSYIHYHGITISRTFKSKKSRQKLLNKSHQYVLKEYLHANFFEILIDKLFCFLKLLFLIFQK